MLKAQTVKAIIIEQFKLKIFIVLFCKNSRWLSEKLNKRDNVNFQCNFMLRKSIKLAKGIECSKILTRKKPILVNDHHFCRGCSTKGLILLRKVNSSAEMRWKGKIGTTRAIYSKSERVTSFFRVQQQICEQQTYTILDIDHDYGALELAT